MEINLENTPWCSGKLGQVHENLCVCVYGQFFMTNPNMLTKNEWNNVVFTWHNICSFDNAASQWKSECTYEISLSDYPYMPKVKMIKLFYQSESVSVYLGNFSLFVQL